MRRVHVLYTFKLITNYMSTSITRKETGIISGYIFSFICNGPYFRTREEIVALLYTHIKAVNQIYESTNFNGIHGINFAIKRTTIYTPSTCKGERAATAGNPFCEENVDVSNYLNMNSQKDHSAFCLAYSLTYRDFIGGTLGLAWVASPSQSIISS